MAAPHQNIADIVVLETAAVEPDFGALNLNSEAPVGFRLAALRKAKGLSHEDVYADTKIKIASIAAIEAGDKAALPATPFTAGFVKAYAQFLGLDADEYARAYKREAGFTPLAAPVQAAPAAAAPAPAILKSPIKAPTPAAPDGDLAKTTALVPISAQAVATVEAPGFTFAAVETRPSTTPRAGDADKMVTWLGAGAAVAVVAFLAGRAAQPAQTTSRIAAAPTVIVAAPAPVVAVEPPAPVTEPAPPTNDLVEALPEPVAVKAPVVKPKPLKRAVLDEAVVEPIVEIPAPVLIAAPVIETPPEPEPAPAPVIVPARVTRSAAPEYPERCAARAPASVGVSVIFSITTAGRPVSASVASSNDRCFNSSALRAVYEMRFAPRTIDGAAAIETAKTVTVQFVR
jgi:TonB family protein